MIRPRQSARSKTILLTAAAFAAVLLGLSACVESTPLANAGGGYSSVGPVTEIDAADRGDPIAFSGTFDTGPSGSSEDWLGSVVVVNFWYAGCAPCRAEAPDLEALNIKYQPDGVQFVGVNVRDQAGTAQSFADAFGVTYPSFLDADGGEIQLAFAGEIAPDAVPTTLVLDRQGRIAARIVGRLDKSILNTLISDAVAEQ
jgi:thiol-disulfide isomerase/thioredoxin